MKVLIKTHPVRVSAEFLETKILPVLRDLRVEYEALSNYGAGGPDLSKFDVAISLGGDGTFLATARIACPAGLPIFGVEVGHLGFLCQVTADDFATAVRAVLDGKHDIEKRSLLRGQVKRKDAAVFESLAVNDAVIIKKGIEPIDNLKTFVSGNLLVSYKADGLIIATPTGSTAYSMSAGGPLVVPTLQAILVTPICAHSLFTRTLVVHGSETIAVVISSETPPTFVTFDGQTSFDLEMNDEVVVRLYDKPLEIIRFGRPTFYEVLSQKFQWGYKYE
jgi:NAD+ kinase